MSTLCVLQPGYLPWLGFFDQLRRADVFVVYDDVQFDKHGWRNRNRVKSPLGPHWLTVPIHHKGLGWPRIDEIKIDNQAAWAKKHVGTIKQFYAKAPHFKTYFPAIEAMLMRDWTLLVDLDLALIGQMAEWFGIERELVRSSALNIQGERSERLLALCEWFGCDRYLSGNAAKDYLEVERFGARGITVEWQDFVHPTYPQQHGEFVPYLSAVDLLLNCGPESLAMLCGPGEKET